MESAWIVEGVDVVEEHRVGLGSGGRRASVEAFGFESGPERLHGGVIIAVGASAHARRHAVGVEQGCRGRNGGVVDEFLRARRRG